ncbi:hypothetical protein [Anatilimnocola aggregata]|nr:hypothetical protein [Anatilimnocola aggregata]
MYVQFKVFRSDWHSWEVLFQQAADFLTEIGPERTISVSHSQEGSVGVVSAWYWTDQPPSKPAA